MNLILDMDQTLIDGMYNDDNPSRTIINARPHLFEFLKFCFENFKSVSIWTAASRFWFNIVNDRIFAPTLKHLKEIGIDAKFDFVFTGNRCTTKWIYSEFHGQSVRITIKRLKKLYRSRILYKKYTRENTLIVDDKKNTFSLNYGNGIEISAWDCYNHDDVELLKLKRYFEKTIFPYFKKHKTIRNLEKRGWSTHSLLK